MAHMSYSQAGEDMIANAVFEFLGVSRPSYLDIGAFDPEYLSNTAFFYEHGSRGVNVEPNADLIRAFHQKRPRDTNLCVGVGAVSGEMDYFCSQSPALNSFSREEHERYKTLGVKHTETRRVKVLTVQKILDTHCGGVFPDFLTIDAEGVDEVVVDSVDLERSAPSVVCIETMSYSTDNSGENNTRLIQKICDKGFFVYGSTWLNTIFVNRTAWAARQRQLSR